jgi:hypothetical protein
MSDEQTSKPKPTMTLGLEELQAIVSTAVAEAVKAAKASEASNQDGLAKAILKVREPYEKPQDKANRESARRSMIKAREDQQRNIAFYQDRVCKHVQGSSPNSSRRSTDSAFFQIVLDTNELIGVCSNCQKVISSLFEEDLPYFQMGGGNVRATAGQQRFFSDPLKVQRARLGLDQKELVIDEATGELVEAPTAEELAESAAK